MYQEYGGGGPDRETPRQEPTPPTPEKTGEEFAAAAEATLDRVEATLESGTLRAEQLASIAAELAEIKKRDTDLNVVQFLKLEELEEKVALQQVEQGAAQPDSDTPDDNFELKDDDDATVVPEPAEPEPTPEPEQRGMVLRNGGTNHEPNSDDDVVDGIWEDVESEDFKNAALIKELNAQIERIWADDVTNAELLDIRQKYPKLALRIAQAIRTLDPQRDKAELDLLSNLSSQIIPDVRARMEMNNSPEAGKSKKVMADIDAWLDGRAPYPPEVQAFDSKLDQIVDAISQKSLTLDEAKTERQKLNDLILAFKKDITSPNGFVSERFANASLVEIFLERMFLDEDDSTPVSKGRAVSLRDLLNDYIKNKEDKEAQDAFRQAVTAHPELAQLITNVETGVLPPATDLGVIEAEITRLVDQKNDVNTLISDPAKPLAAFGNGAEKLATELTRRADERLDQLLKLRVQHFVDTLPTRAEITKLEDAVKKAQADVDPSNALKHIQAIETASTEIRNLSVPPLVVGAVDLSSRVDTTWYSQTLENILKPAMAEVQKLNNVVGLDKARNATEEEYRRFSLKKMLSDWFTQDVNKQGEPKLMLQAAMERKFRLMEGNFVHTYVEARLSEPLKPGEAAPARDVVEREAKEKFKDFQNLCDSVFNLTDFGVMRSDSVNILEFTAEHEAILKAGDTAGAMAVNAGFNTNSFVLGERDPRVLDDEHYLNEELCSDQMGIVQAIVCAAYQKMRDSSKDNRFNISRGYGANEAKDLIDHVCQPEWVDPTNPTRSIPNTQILDYKGRKLSDFNIAKEMARFPAEVQETIKFIAMLKLGRDDLGTKASIWHMGRNKKAMKIHNGGKGKPDGVLASILYQVGKNRVRDHHANLLYFIDPTHTEMSEAEDGADMEVRRMMDEIDNFRRWYAPQWKARRYKPHHWEGDFPGLDFLFNQVGGKRIIEERNKSTGAIEEKEIDIPIKTPNQYHQAEGAVLAILEMACNSLKTALSSNITFMSRQIEEAVIAMNSQIAKTYAFLGNVPQPLFRDDAGRIRMHNETGSWQMVNEKNEPISEILGTANAHYHEMIMAAVEFYFSNFLIEVPGEIPFKVLGLSLQMPGRNKQAEYNLHYDAAVSTIRKAVSSNETSSLNGFWKEQLVGVKVDKGIETRTNQGFLDETDYRRVWRDENLLRNRYHNWRLKPGNMPSLVHTNRVGDIVDMYQEAPTAPTSTEAGWKSPNEYLNK